MSRPLEDFSSFRRDLLYALAANDRASGADIKEALSEDYSAEITHGRFYPALGDLVDAGFVEKEQVNDRTNAYWMTDKGWQRLESDLEWRVSNYEESALTD